MNYKCKECEKEFGSVYALNAHIAYHKKDNKKIKCEYCGKEFTKIGMNKHIRNNHKNKMYTFKIYRNYDKLEFKCEICEKRFSSETKLKLHKSSAHKKNNDNMVFKCDYCNFIAKSKKGLNRHITKNHKEEKEVVVTDFKCDICGKYYKNLSGLNNHRIKTHNANKVIIKKNNVKNKPYTRVDIDKKIEESEEFVECLICNKKLKCINNLHLSLHNLNTKQYRKKFPNCRMRSKKVCYKALKKMYDTNNKKYGYNNVFEREDIREKALSNSCKSNEPNKIEQKIIDLNIKNLVFVGNKNFWLKCEDKMRIPDFILEPITSTKLIVEIFGDYWHDEWNTGMSKENHEKNTINMYKKIGYSCLVIWEHEIKENIDFVKEKIINFILINQSSETTR